MALADEPELHDIADRALRQSLKDPANLRALLGQAVPTLAARFDCERMRVVPRDFLLDDWRGREADLLVEVPFRAGAGAARTTLVCVLIEHRSEPDPRVPLRTLTYAVLYWDRQWRRWQEAEPPRPAFELAPIVPVVFHTAPRPWGSNRTLADLVGGPDELRVFAPAWGPVFWDLAGSTPDELLNSGEAWLQMLAVVRAEEADPTLFARVCGEAIRRLEAVADAGKARWYDLMRIVLTWVYWRRDRGERQALEAVAQSSLQDIQRRQDMQSMKQTIAQSFIEEGRAEGRAQGRAEARAEGLTHLRELVLRVGTRKLGAAPEDVAARLLAIDDPERLKLLGDRVLDVSTWDDLLGF